VTNVSTRGLILWLPWRPPSCRSCAWFGPLRRPFLARRSPFPCGRLLLRYCLYLALRPFGPLGPLLFNRSNGPVDPAHALEAIVGARHFRLEPLLVFADGVEFLRRVKERALDTLRLDRRALGALVYRSPGLSLQPRGGVVEASGRIVGTRRELVELASKSFVGALCGIDEFLPRVVESSFNFRELSVYRVSFASCTGAPRVELTIIQAGILRLSPGLESVSTRPEHAELFLNHYHDDFRLSINSSAGPMSNRRGSSFVSASILGSSAEP